MQVKEKAADFSQWLLDRLFGIFLVDNQLAHNQATPEAIKQEPVIKTELVNVRVKPRKQYTRKAKAKNKRVYKPMSEATKQKIRDAHAARKQEKQNSNLQANSPKRVLAALSGHPDNT